MAITSYRTFVDNLAVLTIDGVKTKIEYPPRSIPAGDLPASWVRSPSGEESPLTAQTHGGWPTLRAELVVAVSPTELDTHKQNYYSTVDMMDNVSAAFRADTVGNLGKGAVSFATRQDFVPVGDTKYWAVVTLVEAHG